mgnify:CR=1 FL=1
MLIEREQDRGRGSRENNASIPTHISYRNVMHSVIGEESEKEKEFNLVTVTCMASMRAWARVRECRV